MEFTDPRLDELTQRGVDGLADVMRRRPDVVEPPPRSLAELADRLDHPGAVHRFLRELTLPHWQVFAAACALDSLPLGDFRERFEVDPLPQLRVLHAGALLELDEAADHVHVPDEVAARQPDPLHLGPNVLVIATQVPPEFVRAAAHAFGCGPTSTGPESAFALAEAYRDADRVRAGLDRLPEHLVAVLRGIAAEYEVDPELGIVVPRRFPRPPAARGDDRRPAARSRRRDRTPPRRPGGHARRGPSRVARAGPPAAQHPGAGGLVAAAGAGRSRRRGRGAGVRHGRGGGPRRRGPPRPDAAQGGRCRSTRTDPPGQGHTGARCNGAARAGVGERGRPDRAGRPDRPDDRGVPRLA